MPLTHSQLLSELATDLPAQELLNFWACWACWAPVVSRFPGAISVGQDQLGGPQIMVPNGVTHQVVRDDQEGMGAILDWLSFVPKAMGTAQGR